MNETPQEHERMKSPRPNRYDQSFAKTLDLFREFQKLRNSHLFDAVDRFLLFKSRLRKHLYWEEQILFHRFKVPGSQDSIDTLEVLKNEHVRIKSLMTHVASHLCTGSDSVIEEENELFKLLNEHHRREQCLITPAIPALLSRTEFQTLLRELPANPRVFQSKPARIGKSCRSSTCGRKRGRTSTSTGNRRN
jgi:hypothetical protein